MKKPIVIDVEKTFGPLFYIGCEEVYEYADNKKTDKVIGYAYNLASTVQGDSVKIKVLGDKKEFDMMAPVRIIELQTNIWTKKSGNYANIQYSFTATDLANG